MKILLAMLISNQMTPSVVMNNQTTNFIETISNEKIDLSKIKLDTTTIETDNIQLDTLEEKIEHFTLEIADNIDNDDAIDALYNSLDYPEQWSLSGYNWDLPDSGETINSKIRYRALSSNDLFKGSLTANIIVTNSSDKDPELSELISNSKLGEIVNPTKEAIERKLLEKNPKLKKDMYEISEYEYDKIILKGKGIFTGQEEIVNFDSKIAFSNTFKSRELLVEAYNLTQSDYDVFTIKHTPVFGKSAFTEYFKILNFHWSGSSAIENKSGFLTEDYDKTDSYALDSGKRYLWDRDYNGSVNWNKTEAYVQSRWDINETLEIEFKVEVKAYATWVNAYWSRAKGQLSIDNLYLS